jgi:hypothetical protein
MAGMLDGCGCIIMKTWHGRLLVGRAIAVMPRLGLRLLHHLGAIQLQSILNVSMTCGRRDSRVSACNASVGGGGDDEGEVIFCYVHGM